MKSNYEQHLPTELLTRAGKEEYSQYHERELGQIDSNQKKTQRRGREACDILIFL